MKLYTEDEVKKAIKADNWTHSENEILEKLTPIVLPSDEEIEKESSKWIAPSQAFRGGAKWVIEQILNQNK